MLNTLSFQPSLFSRVPSAIASVCSNFTHSCSCRRSTIVTSEPPQTHSSKRGERLTFTPGQSHTALRHYADIATIHGPCSLGDRVRSKCRLAFSMAQNGAYAAAKDSLASLHGELKGTLKLEQRVNGFARLISLLQFVRRYVQQPFPTTAESRAHYIVVLK